MFITVALFITLQNMSHEILYKVGNISSYYLYLILIGVMSVQLSTFTVNMLCSNLQSGTRSPQESTGQDRVPEYSTSVSIAGCVSLQSRVGGTHS